MAPDMSLFDDDNLWTNGSRRVKHFVGTDHKHMYQFCGNNFYIYKQLKHGGDAKPLGFIW